MFEVLLESSSYGLKKISHKVCRTKFTSYAGFLPNLKAEPLQNITFEVRVFLKE